MPALTLLQMTREFCRRRGLPVPSTVVGSQDDSQAQIWGLLNEGISELADRYEWQHLRRPHVFTHANGPEYGALDFSNNGTLLDCKAVLNRTLWDVSGRREVFGPMDAKSWSAMLNMGVSQAVYNYTVYLSAVRIYPVPNPIIIDQFRIEYVSNFAVVNPATNEHTLFYDTDASWPLFPTALVLQDLKWRWNQAKGLAYAEDFRQCEAMIMNLQARDLAPDVVMDSGGFNDAVSPGLLIAAGSWPL